MAIYPSHQDRSVLVTGGGGGIGAAVVEAFSKQSARVAFIERDAEVATRTADAMAALGLARPLFRICDLRDIAAARAATADLASQAGPFTALINNAGNDQAQAFADVTVEDWDDRVAVNLRHQFFMAQAVAEPMARAGGGAIVNLGSVSWMIGAMGVPVYATLKSAVSGLTKTLARELGPKNIRVNAIAPGWVLTERQLEKGRADPGKFDDYLTRQCIKQHLRPIDVAEMALWLTADESARCAGQVFVVDGGVS